MVPAAAATPVVDPACDRREPYPGVHESMVVSDGPTGFAPVVRVATVSVVRRTIPMLLVLIVAAVAVGVATAVIGDPQLVSRDNTGVNRTGDALGSAVSADGRWVAFTSADNLAGTPTAGVKQLYVRDTVGGRTSARVGRRDRCGGQRRC